METTTASSRIARAREALERTGADWLIVPPSADFRWLTGAVARSSERLVALAVGRQGETFCVVPRLEAEALADECPWLELLVWEENEDPLARLGERIGLARRPSLLLGDGFRTAPLLALARAATCREAALALAPLRVIKDRDEIERLETAARHADQVVEEAADFMRPGMTEREIERFIFDRFETLGDTAAWAIVASGPHSALPHHATSRRRLLEGEVVLLDLGAQTEGYGSDITRTFWLGAPPPGAEQIYEVVNRARAAGIAAAGSGARAGDVDRAARAVIEAAGHGPCFVHRTGHGVGLEIHEPPYLVAGSAARLETGMVHSVEPGIYLPGRFGIRLEDLVVVEPQGGRRLNHAPLEPLPLRVRG